MACGDTVDQWIPSITGSVYSGGDSYGRTIVTVFTRSPATAASVVDGVPLVGTWQLTTSNHLQWTAQTEGISYTFDGTPDVCNGGRVTNIGGDVGDSFNIHYTLTMTKVL